ncbi:MAG: superoxide dismutase family protein [Ruminococcus sp.]|nr:superoxide dismutase family protein [Ruminococcus sp.]
MFTVNRRLLLQRPCSTAVICGSAEYPEIHGTVSFFKACNGSLVVAEIFNLPSANGVFAIHIHNGTECTGNADDPFANAGSHLNFTGTEHPFHTGDLPALFSNDGYSWVAFYTNRFCPAQVTGYPVIIHANPDDFHTQPSGNSGKKIACGLIK